MRIRSNDPLKSLIEYIQPIYLVTRCREHGTFKVDRDVGHRRFVSLDDVDDLQSYRIEDQHIARRSMRVFAPSVREWRSERWGRRRIGKEAVVRMWGQGTNG